MTPDEIINKWIDGPWEGDDAATSRAIVGICSEMKADIQQAITAAVEEKDKRIAELESIITHSRQVAQDAWLGRQIKAAVDEEREACATIVHEVYLAWVEGDYSPGEAFESAKEKIRHSARRNKSVEEQNDD